MSKNLSPCTMDTLEQAERTEEQFWSDFYPKLKRYCYFLAQNQWDGDDIAQETYVKALKYQSSQKLSAALVNKIAYNHWIDILRKRKKETLEFELELVSNSEAKPEEKTGVVELLLNKFTPKQAVILLLKEGFRYQIKEIAEILGTTEMAVKSSLHRAKRRLEKEKEVEKSLELFWDEEEREQLAVLFQETLEAQDPTVLIEAISSFDSISNGVNMSLMRIETRRKPTPSSTLYMAA